jgi:hypothetical protein
MTAKVKAKGPKAKSINAVAAAPTKVVPKASAASVSGKKSPTRMVNAAVPNAALASPARNKPLTQRPAAKALPQVPMVAAPRILPTAPADLVGTSKQARLIAKLTVGPGATIQQMMALTGWQAHTVRGTISGALRKRLGLNVVCEPLVQGGERLYRIVGSVAA